MKHPTIFLHIPKAGGTTLRNILTSQVQENQFFHLYEDMATLGQELGLLQNMSAEEKANLRLVAGHFRFGLHRLFQQPFSYVTFLRNPYKRIVSQYWHIHRRPKHYLYEQVVGKKLSLEEFILSGLSIELDNAQTRLIGTDFDQPLPSVGSADQAMLDLAKKRLDESFLVVGIQEQFDESLLLIEEKLGLKNVVYERKNVNQASSSGKSSLSDRELEAIAQTHRLDLELYDYAKNKLASELEVRPQFFEEGLKKLESRNQRYIRKVQFSRRISNLLKKFDR
ncbi:sulfotransferase family 2 domain-containing protein [Pontibacter sp. G13]|uniref:sulfotransferase family 2 domain-containing protein n=1 Tax=Pontibacter sp. G13 TaxID=3074898 RepID=UPI0028898D2A|nr:sulfotransferase family 2 domain-containing protein [Pontibacter sp. G13]WNJ16402.1 sulfotransferase family 2 domain-containing protein [Pontibacter sp. G13]